MATDFFLSCVHTYVRMYITENQPLPGNDRNLPEGPAGKEYVPDV